MTLILSSNTTTTQNLAAAADIVITSGVSLLVGDDFAIQSVGGLHIQNYGFIHGQNGAVSVGNQSGSVTMLHNGISGVITTGLGGSAAVFVENFHSIINDGQISGNHWTGNGILVSGSGNITNSGVISGRVGVNDYSINNFNELTNSGTIRGTYYAILVQQNTSYTIYNSGVIEGAIKLGDGGNFFDSSEGILTRALAAGSGEDILYAGRANTSVHGMAGNDTIKANAGDDTINGGDGDDVVSGDEGNDWIYVLQDQGKDTIDGGSGIDFLSLDWSNAAVDLILSIAAPAILQELGDGTTVENIERMSVVAGSGHDRLTGGNLSDTLSGGAGNDTLNGGGGVDGLLGGAGADTYVVDRRTDVVTESVVSTAASESDLVQYVGTSGTYILGANVERLILGGTAAINGFGNSGANTITGNAAANTINGMTGADTMSGMGGADSYFADMATDVVIETLSGAAGGVDHVTFFGSTGTFTLGANVENLTLAGAAAINGTGNTLANTITGNAASNVITGGLGNDSLTGGLGADFFVFNTVANTTTNKDTITDFSALDDTIRLENTGIFTALGVATGVLNATLFKNVSLAAVDANDRILYNDGTGTISYDIDGSGAAVAVVLAVITGAPTLTNADFIVI